MVQAVIPVLRNGRREDQHFKASPTYIKKFGTSLRYEKILSKKKKNSSGR